MQSSRQNMVRGEDVHDDDPDIEVMMLAGVGIDHDGDFDPADLLQVPLDQDIDDLRELCLNVEDEEDPAPYMEHVDVGAEAATCNESSHAQQNSESAPRAPIAPYNAEDERSNGKYYDEDFRNVNMGNNNDHDRDRNNINRDGRDRFFGSPPSPDSRGMSHGRDQRQYLHDRDRFVPDRNDGRGAVHHSRHSPHGYDAPSPYNSSRHNNNNQRNPSTELQSNRHPPRRQKRDPQRIAEVQQRILQVQEQIREVQHENMDHEQIEQHYQMRGDHRHHDQQEHGFSHQRNQRHHQHLQNQHPHHVHHQHQHQRHHQQHQQGYPEDYPGDSYNRNGNSRDLPGDTRFPPRHSGSRMPRNMRGGDNGFRGDQQRHNRSVSHQPPHQPSHQHQGESMPSQSLNSAHSVDGVRANGNDFGPHDRMEQMNSMRRCRPPHTMAQSLNGRPSHNNDSQGGFGSNVGGPHQQHQQHVVGGMSRSLNGIPGHSNDNMSNNSMMHHHGQPQNMRSRMPRSLNGPPNGRVQNLNMNSSNNGGMPSRRGIQSMSDSLNGMSNGTQPMDNHNEISNQPNMMDRSNSGNMPQQNMMNRSNSGSMPQQSMMDRSNSGTMPQQNMMDRSNNGSMPQQRGIQSMSDSLNGVRNTNNGNNTDQNSMMNSNSIVSQQQRGVQSISRSTNGLQQGISGQMMSQSRNGMPISGENGNSRGQHHGYHQQQIGAHSMGMQMSRSLNGTQTMQQNYNEGGFLLHQVGTNRVNPMSSVARNEMTNMNAMQGRCDDYGPHQPRAGQNALQGMSQSLNGAQNTNFGKFGHRRSMSNQMNSMSRNRDMHMNNSNSNMMPGSNGMPNNNSLSMTASNNGGPVLNNSNVPSAPLLNQVSNLANLPNRGGGNSPAMTQQQQGAVASEEDYLEEDSEQEGNGNSKTGNPMALAEATMRSASSRKMIRELGLSLVKLQRNAGDGGGQSKTSSSSNSKQTVVKAKRKSGRESYTKLHSDAPFREHARQMKVQKQQTASS